MAHSAGLGETRGAAALPTPLAPARSASTSAAPRGTHPPCLASLPAQAATCPGWQRPWMGPPCSSQGPPAAWACCCCATWPTQGWRAPARARWWCWCAPASSTTARRSGSGRRCVQRAESRLGGRCQGRRRGASFRRRAAAPPPGALASPPRQLALAKARRGAAPPAAPPSSSHPPLPCPTPHLAAGAVHCPLHLPCAGRHPRAARMGCPPRDGGTGRCDLPAPRPEPLGACNPWRCAGEAWDTERASCRGGVPCLHARLPHRRMLATVGILRPFSAPSPNYPLWFHSAHWLSPCAAGLC